jgi:hypothetical protein
MLAPSIHPDTCARCEFVTEGGVGEVGFQERRVQIAG